MIGKSRADSAARIFEGDWKVKESEEKSKGHLETRPHSPRIQAEATSYYQGMRREQRPDKFDLTNSTLKVQGCIGKFCWTLSEWERAVQYLHYPSGVFQ
jgi:hypothetical protein